MPNRTFRRIRTGLAEDGGEAEGNGGSSPTPLLQFELHAFRARINTGRVAGVGVTKLSFSSFSKETRVDSPAADIESPACFIDTSVNKGPMSIGSLPNWLRPARGMLGALATAG